MPIDPDIWDAEAMPASPANDALFAAFEKKHNVRLPESFKELYLIQNGGVLADVDEPETLFALGADADDLDAIQPLTEWAESVAYSRDDLGWIEKEWGDPDRLFVLHNDGHIVFALDYNHTNEGEPSVIRLSTEGFYGDLVAPSFSSWLHELTAAESSPTIEWEEHAKYSLLFHEVLPIQESMEGRPEEVEQAVCREGDHGLLLFRRAKVNDEVVRLERTSLPNGVNSRRLKIEKLGREPNILFHLPLEAVEDEGLEAIVARKKRNGLWRIKGLGYQAENAVESTSRDKLQQLVVTFCKAGLAHRPRVTISQILWGIVAVPFALVSFVVASLVAIPLVLIHMVARRVRKSRTV